MMQALPIADLEPLLWASPRAGYVSAWHGHVSFGHWLVHALQPAITVELGSHNGVSFASFCNAAQRTGLATKTYAIDTWQGDEQAGFYDSGVYDDLQAFVQAQYPTTARLIRSLFDDALQTFADGSVDLLHIDGLHTYEAVRHDFETWRPKLSQRGVVLFHDTTVRTQGFGVWRFWDELGQRYPGFNFHHSSGLGVLAFGPAVPAAIIELCQAEGTPAADPLRHRFAQASATAFQSGQLEHDARVRQRLLSIEATGTNLALGRPAFQSSAAAGGPTPQGAVNGSKTGRYGFHTALEAAPWWMVDLGLAEPIDEVVVYNRLDSGCQQRSNTLVVLTSIDGESWRQLYAHSGPPFGGADGAPLRIPCPGERARFVRIRLRDEGILHLDEVEIYQAAKPA